MNSDSICGTTLLYLPYEYIIHEHVFIRNFSLFEFYGRKRETQYVCCNHWKWVRATCKNVFQVENCAHHSVIILNEHAHTHFVLLCYARENLCRLVTKKWIHVRVNYVLTRYDACLVYCVYIAKWLNDWTVQISLLSWKYEFLQEMEWDSFSFESGWWSELEFGFHCMWWIYICIHMGKQIGPLFAYKTIWLHIHVCWCAEQQTTAMTSLLWSLSLLPFLKSFQIGTANVHGKWILKKVSPRLNWLCSPVKAMWPCQLTQ